MDGRVVYDYQISQLEGRLLTLIESLGLRESQESAVKDMLKGIVREIMYTESTYVFGEYLHEAIQKQREDRRDQSNEPVKVN